MKSQKSLMVFLAIIIFSGSIQFSHAQDLSNTYNYSIKLAITPSHIESGENIHPVGYVYVLNKNNVAITSSEDVDIILHSDNPEIAKVPEHVTLFANEEFATFDITTGILSGETLIHAELNGKKDFQPFRVGIDKTYLPDDAILELNIPTDQMHVHSSMPFTVFLKTPDGNIIRAPYNIDIQLDYEKSLAAPNKDILTIKKGEFYAWGTFTTNDKVGNTFLRAIQFDTGLDTAQSIHVSSTLPSALSIDVFPKSVPVEIDRKIDIFVSLLDSDGNPTIASKDIPLKFFSNDQDVLGDDLDDLVESVNPVLRKGQFGYHLAAEFDLINYLKNDIMIGVSAEGYGIATDSFSTVGESIDMDDPIFSLGDQGNNDLNPVVIDRTVKLFGLDQIPSNATSLIAFQISAIEDDDDDEDVVNDDELEDDDNKLIHTIDDLDNDELYPVQAIDNYRSDGLIQLLNVVSDDIDILKILDIGNIESSYSYGTALIRSGQDSGNALISASIKGAGSDTFVTSVVNSLEQVKTLAFSPVGQDIILIDDDGYFDLFLVALDAQNRPKVLENDSKYLLSPTNGLVEIKKDDTYVHGTFHSDSFDVTENTNAVLKIIPIGEGANLDLENTMTFSTQPSSQLLVMLPMGSFNVNNNDEHIGVVQLVDLHGNPMPSTTSVKTKITSTETSILQIIDDAIIPAGISHSSFPIQTNDVLGGSTISVSAKGVIGSEIDALTTSSLSRLKIFSSGLEDQIQLDKPMEIQIFIDDDNADSVPGASITINTDDNVRVEPKIIKTNADGSATIQVTALEGPDVSLNLLATAEGYVDSSDVLVIPVNGAGSLSVADLEFPEWIVYVVIFAILMVGVLVFLFLKKSKTVLEEDWEEEEI